MKLLVPLPLRRRLRQAATRRCATTNSTNSSKPSANGSAEASGVRAAEATPANGVPAVRASTANPGTVRVRRGTDPRAKEMEMDTTIARIMGSDWGDRSKQPVSLAMRVYWGIFIVVLANGAFTYFAGKDEKFLVDKVQKKVDEKLGRVETNEFVVMAGQPNAQAALSDPEQVSSSSVPAHQAEAKATPVAKDPDFSLSDTSPKSVFSSPTMPTPMPYFGAPVAARGNTKADYERQLQQLRQRQARAREERTDPSRFRSLEEINVEIKRIDQQKAQLKQILKKL